MTSKEKERIIKELEDLKTIYEEEIKETTISMFLLGKMNGIIEAIGIVKRSGTSDELNDELNDELTN